MDFRWDLLFGIWSLLVAGVVELVDTRDLKSLGHLCPYGFKSRPRYIHILPAEEMRSIYEVPGIGILILLERSGSPGLPLTSSLTEFDTKSL